MAGITAAVAALSGPAHGGAAENVMRMARFIGDPAKAAAFVKARRKAREPIHGLRSPGLPGRGPPRQAHARGRQAALRGDGQPHWHAILEALVEAMRPYARHGVNVNVDFYAGVVYYLHGIPEDLFVPIFAIGRIPGWTVQAMEQFRKQYPNPPAPPLHRARGQGLHPDSTSAGERHAAASGHRSGDCGGGHDVIDRRAAREIAQRPREALQEGTDRAHAAQVLAELVADVAGVEVRKHEDIGLARDIARVPGLERGNPRHDGGIRLELAVDRELRSPRADDLHGAADLLDPFVLRTAVGRERQHRHPRGDAQQPLGARRRGDGDIRERIGVRVDGDRAIGEDSGSLPLGTMMKKLDGVAMPSARPTDISPASMTRAVGWVAPATSASASPAFTAIAA